MQYRWIMKSQILISDRRYGKRRDEVFLDVYIIVYWYESGIYSVRVYEKKSDER